jgi:Beta-propeller repeat
VNASNSKARSVSLLATTKPDSAERARLSESFGKLPLYFTENRGQLDSRVAFYVQGSDKTLYFTSRGITFALNGEREEQTGPDPHMQKTNPGSAFRTQSDEKRARQRWGLKLDFVGARPDVKPTGQEETGGVISYFKGQREQLKTGLKTYSKLVYSDLWPGIDLVYSGTVSQLKYSFLVKPGADPNQIRLAYSGATSVRLNEGGDLEVSTPAGGFRDDKPYSYQEIEERHVEVPTAYSLESSRNAGRRLYGFRVGAYDKHVPLVIDPVVLLYAGYIGGSNYDEGNGIAVDSAGNTYITGTTFSLQGSFPATVGPDLTYNNYNGQPDAFVAKVNVWGTALMYCGYIGGSFADEGFGIAVDRAGNAYVTGTTESPDFPAIVGPDLTYNGGQEDAFVAKVNAAGTALIYAGYIGGANPERNTWGRGFTSIDVDAFGNAYVTGTTRSNETSFPVTVGPDLIYNGGIFGDAFVAKVNAAGTAFIYCGYIGGSSSDSGNSIAVDTVGNGLSPSEGAIRLPAIRSIWKSRSDRQSKESSAARAASCSCRTPKEKLSRPLNGIDSGPS